MKKYNTCVISYVWLFATPWTVTHQAPLSMESFHARILELVVTSYYRGSSQPRDHTRISCISCSSRQSLHHRTAWEAKDTITSKVPFHGFWENRRGEQPKWKLLFFYPPTQTSYWPWLDCLVWVEGDCSRVLKPIIQSNWKKLSNGTPLQYSCLENPMDGGAW